MAGCLNNRYPLRGAVQELDIHAPSQSSEPNPVRLLFVVFKRFQCQHAKRVAPDSTLAEFNNLFRDKPSWTGTGSGGNLGNSFPSDSLTRKRRLGSRFRAIADGHRRCRTQTRGRRAIKAQLLYTCWKGKARGQSRTSRTRK